MRTSTKLSSFAAALALHLGAATAFAADSAELRCGVEAYERGEYEQAAICLRKALASGAAPERARAQLFLALTHGARKQMAAAREAFKAALIEDPEVEPERDRVPPEILVEYDAVRAIATGELSVTGDEPGARVLIDGQDGGAVPLATRVPAGRRRVRVVSADGYRRWEDDRVIVRVGLKQALRASFVAEVGRVTVDVSPAGALVRIAGRPLTLPHKGEVTVPAGKHRFLVSRPGFVDVDRELVIEKGQTVLLRERLAVQPPHQARWLGGWASVGVGAAGLLTATVLGVLARSAASDITTRQRSGGLDTPTYLELQSTADSRARWSTILFATGGAAAATGVVLLLLSSRERAAAATGPTVRVLPTLQGAALAVTF